MKPLLLKLCIKVLVRMADLNLQGWHEDQGLNFLRSGQSNMQFQAVDPGRQPRRRWKVLRQVPDAQQIPQLASCPESIDVHQAQDCQDPHGMHAEYHPEFGPWARPHAAWVCFGTSWDIDVLVTNKGLIKPQGPPQFQKAGLAWSDWFKTHGTWTTGAYQYLFRQFDDPLPRGNGLPSSTSSSSSTGVVGNSSASGSSSSSSAGVVGNSSSSVSSRTTRNSARVWPGKTFARSLTPTEPLQTNKKRIRRRSKGPEAPQAARV